MKRRNFILLASTGAAAIAIPSIYLKYNATNNGFLEIPLPLTNIWDKETLLKIGNQYKTQFPDENTTEKLIDLLTQGKPNLELKIKKDFETDNIVIFDGWMLSKTEARQCALFSLTQSKID
jgi:hypothetical protein